MFIRYDGTNGEAIRRALVNLKPGSGVVIVPFEGGLSFDQVWPDGQYSEDRWRIRLGQHLDSATGAVVDEVPAS